MKKYPFLRIALILFLLLIIVYPSSSQEKRIPGSIITLKGDTLKGFIVLRPEARMSVACEFYGEVTATYKPGEITAYVLEGYPHYSSMLFKNAANKDSLLFLREEIEGPLSLFSFFDNYSGKCFVAGNDEKGFYEIPLVTYLDQKSVNVFKKSLGILKILTNECSKVLGKEEEIKAIIPKYLSKVVNSYNECVDPENYARKKKVKTIKVRYYRLVLNAGSGYHSLGKTLSDFSKDLDHGFSGFPVVAGINVESGTLFSRFSVRAGFQYRLGLYSSTNFDSKVETEMRYNLYKLKMTTLSVPVSVKYDILKKEIRPYIVAGLEYNILVYNSFINEERQFFDKDYLTETDLIDETEEYPRHMISVNGGLGVQYQINERMGFRLEGSYHVPLEIFGSYEHYEKPAFRPVCIHGTFGYYYRFN